MSKGGDAREITRKAPSRQPLPPRKAAPKSRPQAAVSTHRMTPYEGYAPSKETAIAVALAARLTLDEARDLLHVAGYALSDSIPADIVYAACFRHQVYERAHVRALLGEFSRGRIATQIAL